MDHVQGDIGGGESIGPPAEVVGGEAAELPVALVLDIEVIAQDR
ncbi:hypothetical protein AB0A71_24415 [Kitasatospora aureofaciens]